MRRKKKRTKVEMMRDRLTALKKARAQRGMTPEEFRDVRLRAGLTQHEFAERIGYHRMSMTRFENGSQPIGPWLAKLVLALFRQGSGAKSPESAMRKKPRSSRVAG